MKNYLKIITIDEYSVTPKYRQLANCIIAGIKAGDVVKGDMLPSINDLSIALDLSRGSIERAYNDMKKAGIVATIPGKGCFVNHTEFNDPTRVLLLFNKLSTHKKIIYDAFVETLGSNASVDFYVYNNDAYLFKKILNERALETYHKLVILPYFIDDYEESYRLINSLPKNKLIIMDKLPTSINGEFAAVYEDFANDIYSALLRLNDHLKKYRQLKLIFPDGAYYSQGIIRGFENFCLDLAFDFEVLSTLEHHEISPETVYINVAEDDLIKLIRKIKHTPYVIGKDVGLISYNETDIKEVILDGITTISTDFVALGMRTAELVMNDEKGHYAVPFNVVVRNSL
ncbi:GntR family transcriptional regulator [Mucilaginibacter roseus]|uniref:GntR family transcriptional regulator n=1 Tax=Mucilaginibacter roseus TaxID=1528868 RepID=A0ABS8U084_9SPHI|nr:GntR family transcriptional regulator [Mucilaginibacter roseus]MCD8739262.1 GntR family transcriptional regulator [Mucilaginibacter roseus]